LWANGGNWLQTAENGCGNAVVLGGSLSGFDDPAAVATEAKVLFREPCGACRRRPWIDVREVGPPHFKLQTQYFCTISQLICFNLLHHFQNFHTFSFSGKKFFRRGGVHRGLTSSCSVHAAAPDMRTTMTSNQAGPT